MKVISLKNVPEKLALSAREGTAILTFRDVGEIAHIKIKLRYTAAFGMGEKYDGLNNKGKRVENVVTEKFCRQGAKTYCPAPFFFTDSGFGLYCKTSAPTVFEFGDEITVTLPKDCEIVTFSGTPKEIISEYMSLFGKAKLPPKWAFGPFISANHWNSESKVEKALAQLQNYKFPATVIVLEAWSDEATFYIFNGAEYREKEGAEAFSYDDFNFKNSPWRDPKAMIEKLHEAGLHLLLWQVPVYKKQGVDEARIAQNDLDRAYAKEHSLCVKTSGGKPYEIPEGNWFAGSMIPDFTNPETRKLWFKKRQYLLDIGVDGFKTDGGEFIYRDDLHFFDSETGHEMKNRYAQSYAESYSHFVGENRIIFSRAGFSGQHTTPIHWAGDQQSENSELRAVLSAGLSAAMTGIPFWGFDIAGFAGKLPTPDLYRRATQMACFSPIMQWHSEPDGGQFKDILKSEKGNNERSPWNIARVNNSPEFVDEMRFWHNLRMNLLPYIYSSAVKCTEKSEPLIRPLCYDFFDDKTALGIDDEYMFGESMLVAPLLAENAKKRTVYLPKGEWSGLFDKIKYSGSKTYELECSSRLPVFIRAGCAVPLNLASTLELGSAVGNSVDSYKNLVFYLAGSEGEYYFNINPQISMKITWNPQGVTTDGGENLNFTLKPIV